MSLVKVPRRRWTRWATVSAGVLTVVSGTLSGAGWYFSTEVLKVDHSMPEMTLDVIAINDVTLTLPKNVETLKPGVWGVHYATGVAIIGDVTEATDKTVTRELIRAAPDLVKGTKVRMDARVYRADPVTDHQIEYENVTVPGELGDLPAWYIRGESNTWVVAVHGRNAAPTEALRAIPQYHRSGVHVLAVTYRNDVGAAPSPDGYHHLGDSEWKDVAAAVDYAMDHGASSVILAGWSMGGAIVMTALRRMDNPSRVAGVVLDSPVVDWASTLDKQAGQRNLPAPLTATAKWLVEWRASLELVALDQRTYAPNVNIPMLLFIDLADDTVDYAATLEFADKVPDEHLTLVTTQSGHTASWNENPDTYEATLAKFLTDLV